MPSLFNFRIAKKPMNWIIVVLMTMIFFTGVDLISRMNAQSKEG